MKLQWVQNQEIQYNCIPKVTKSILFRLNNLGKSNWILFAYCTALLKILNEDIFDLEFLVIVNVGTSTYIEVIFKVSGKHKLLLISTKLTNTCFAIFVL